MIEGRVNSQLEAAVFFNVKGPAGQSRLIEAVIDTGYSEYLTLPSAHVRALGLQYRERGHAALADGTMATFDVYDAELVWDGQHKAVPVDESASAPLVGMSLLEGHELRIEARSGGQVLIEPLDV